ncbi:MAG: thioredoxin domain-containing protein, partial [Chlorobiota bacterium]
RPARDEKVLCDWNALAIVALARAGRLLRKPTLIEQAHRAWSYIARVHLRADGTIAHCSYSGEPTVDGFLDDYAFAAWAAIELYHATGVPDFLAHVQRLLRSITERFIEDDGIVRTAASADVLPLTEPSDGSTVSGVGIAALVAAVHGLVAAEETSATLAQRILERYGGSVQENPAWHATLLSAWLHASQGSLLEIECPPEQREKLEQVLAMHYDPLRIDRVVNSAAAAFRAQRCTPAACIPLNSWDEFCRNVLLSSQSTLEAPGEQ